MTIGVRHDVTESELQLLQLLHRSTRSVAWPSFEQFQTANFFCNGATLVETTKSLKEEMNFNFHWYYYEPTTRKNKQSTRRCV